MSKLYNIPSGYCNSAHVLVSGLPQNGTIYQMIMLASILLQCSSSGHQHFCNVLALGVYMNCTMYPVFFVLLLICLHQTFVQTTQPLKWLFLIGNLCLFISLYLGIILEIEGKGIKGHFFPIKSNKRALLTWATCMFIAYLHCFWSNKSLKKINDKGQCLEIRCIFGLELPLASGICLNCTIYSVVFWTLFMCLHQAFAQAAELIPIWYVCHCPFTEVDHWFSIFVFLCLH